MNEGQCSGFITDTDDIIVCESYESAKQFKNSIGIGSNIISKDTQAELIAYLNASLESQVNFREEALNKNSKKDIKCLNT